MTAPPYIKDKTKLYLRLSSFNKTASTGAVTADSTILNQSDLGIGLQIFDTTNLESLFLKLEITGIGDLAVNL